jgi:hypothetical protein
MVAAKGGKEAEVAKSIETEKALLETTTAKRCRLKLKLATENEERPKPTIAKQGRVADLESEESSASSKPTSKPKPKAGKRVRAAPIEPPESEEKPRKLTRPDRTADQDG